MDSVGRHAYRVDVHTRASLYYQAMASIPPKYLAVDDVQRSIAPLDGDTIYYKVADRDIEFARARAVWYCSYVAAGSYQLGQDYAACVIHDRYAMSTDRVWVGLAEDGRVVATARALMADQQGRFQIHDPATGFGSLSLPANSPYGARLPQTPEEIAATREVSAFAVALEARTWQRNALVGLTKTLMNNFIETGIRYGYSSIDESFFLLVNHMGMRLEQIGEKSVYMGGMTVPNFFKPDLLIEGLKDKHEALYEFMSGYGAIPFDSKYAFYHRIGQGAPIAVGGE